ncbi:MAG TPA: hypothetical protein VI488_10925 [Candidatus Angelobacter sp.]
MNRAGDPRQAGTGREIARDRVIGKHGQMIRCPGVPITRSPDHRITRSSNRLHHVLHTILATLREIFDESAYERFLVRTHASRSAESYREFLRERETGIARQPRCC